MHSEQRRPSERGAFVEIFHCIFPFQGDPASGMYFVEAGKVTVIKRGENGEEKKVNAIITLTPPVQNNGWIQRPEKFSFGTYGQ